MTDIIAQFFYSTLLTICMTSNQPQYLNLNQNQNQNQNLNQKQPTAQIIPQEECMARIDLCVEKEISQMEENQTNETQTNEIQMEESDMVSKALNHCRKNYQTHAMSIKYQELQIKKALRLIQFGPVY